jgi:hypothetical protein
VFFFSVSLFSCQGDEKDDDLQSIQQSQTTLTIVSIDPTSGSSVNSSTTLTADIRYSIANYSTTQSYAVIIWFKRTDDTSELNDLTNGIESVASASGNVTHVYPLSADIADSVIKKPLEIMYSLHACPKSGTQPGEFGFDYDGTCIALTTVVTYPVQ